MAHDCDDVWHHTLGILLYTCYGIHQSEAVMMRDHGLHTSLPNN